MARRIISPETKNKISKTLSGRTLSSEHKKNISMGLSGHATSYETKERIKQSAVKNYSNNDYVTKRNEGIIRASKEGKMGKGFPRGHKINLRRRHSAEIKCKIRKNFIEYLIKTGKTFSVVGRNERKLLDEQEIVDKCKILRQYHIKELGYTVDGYCPETNTVYEVYEKLHDKKVFKDLDRENEICNHLSSDFVIIWDKEFDPLWKK